MFIDRFEVRNGGGLLLVFGAPYASIELGPDMGYHDAAILDGILRYFIQIGHLHPSGNILSSIRMAHAERLQIPARLLFPA